MKSNLFKFVGEILMAFILLPLAGLLAFGQTATSPSPSPLQQTEEQQLKERVKQLEETVEALKRQMKAVEEARVAKDASGGETGTPVAETAAAKIAPTAEKPKSDAPQDDTSKKTGGTFEISGFAMLDAGFQAGSNDPNWFDVMRPTKLAAFKDEFAPNGHTYFGVRQSRLSVRSSTPTKYGELKTIFEFELFGTGVDAGQTTFRLRHAYGQLGHFGAGQYWTAFMDPDVFPNQLEYWGPNGLVWFRNVQLRWMPLMGKNSATIALERPGASADQGNFADRIELQGVKPKFAWPDLTGNVRFDRDWGHVQFAGLVRSIRWVDTNNDKFDLGGHAVGVGGSVSSVLNFSKNNVGRMQFTYGTGIENYMNDAPVDVAIKNNFGDPFRPIKGVALPVFGMSTFLDHTWSKRFSTAIGYSMLQISNSNGQEASAFKRGHYGLVNLLFNPMDRVTIGGEFQWGRRVNFLDGFGVNDYHVQFGFKYNFSKVFEY